MNSAIKSDALSAEARSLIEKTRETLKINSSKVDSETVGIINSKVRAVENALKEGDSEHLQSAYAELKKTFSNSLYKFSKSKTRQNLEALAFALILALLIRTFVVQPFKIPSGSMIPTLLIGDHLLVNKFMYGTNIPFTKNFLLPLRDIEKGDVIVFTYPNYEKEPAKEGIYYIKRVVGIPGDSIDIDGRDLIINGRRIPREYETVDNGTRDYFDTTSYDLYEEDLFGNLHKALYEKIRENTHKGSEIPVSQVPDGQYFVMGDNRDNSHDSRFWGFVPRENIVGKAFVIHWSWNTEASGTSDFIRWRRLGTLIN